MIGQYSLLAFHSQAKLPSHFLSELWAKLRWNIQSSRNKVKIPAILIRYNCKNIVKYPVTLLAFMILLIVYSNNGFG
jgi:hypothetical protein